MKSSKLIPIILLFLCLTTPFYLSTGIVYEEDWSGHAFVVKPYPGFVTHFHRMKEIDWEKSHPNEPIAWWQSGNYRKIAYISDHGGAELLWELGYGIGELLTILGWPILIVILIIRRYRKHHKKKIVTSA
jgi:hypothetical protein